MIVYGLRFMIVFLLLLYGVSQLSVDRMTGMAVFGAVISAYTSLSMYSLLKKSLDRI